MNNIVQIFKALSDETRLKILILLSQKSICAKGISKHLGISEAAISQHIKILKDAGIITGEKIGYYVIYNLQQAAFLDISNFLTEIESKTFSDNYSFNISLPRDCNVICKSNKNKCCKKSII